MNTWLVMLRKSGYISPIHNPISSDITRGYHGCLEPPFKEIP